MENSEVKRMRSARRNRRYYDENSEDDNDFDSDDSLKDPHFTATLIEDGSTSHDSTEDAGLVASTSIPKSREERTGRKRKRGVSQAVVNSVNKNAGKIYRKYRGKGNEMKSAEMGENCRCPKKCFDRIGENDRQHLCQSFWKLQDFNSQNSFIFSLIKIENVKRRYTKADSKRSISVIYNLLVKMQLVPVCKKAFASILGLQNHIGRINNLVKKIKIDPVSPIDKRGRHTSHPHKYTDDAINQVHKHIELFPKYESHYSRKKNLNRLYMSMEYSIKSLYENYRTCYCEDNNIQPVSEDKYRRIFTEDFNISFQHPKSDTCPRCDELNVKIRATQKNEEEHNQCLKERELHLRKAENGQTNISNQTEIARRNSKYHVITFDLQQALPTPKLSTGPAFYKRKLWTYNFSVHNCGTGQGNFFLWDETVAKRGSEEIISCLKKYFESNDVQGDTLVAISDNCCGQNKNWNMIGFWMWLLSTGRFTTIEHHFPVPGHTMLPSDRDFAVVEKYVRRHVQYVYTPDEWAQILEKCAVSKPFKVIKMKQHDFVTSVKLNACFQRKQMDEENQAISLRNCTAMVFKATQPFKMFLRHTYSVFEAERIVNMRRRGRGDCDFSKMEFPRKYPSLLPIPGPKYKDVMSCVKWIPPIYADFYNTLKCSGTTSQELLSDEENAVDD